MTTVVQQYIEIDDRGVAKVIGSRSKVKQIVIDQRGGYSPEQIHEAYPHLSMAQIHAAFTPSIAFDIAIAALISPI